MRPRTRETTFELLIIKNAKGNSYPNVTISNSDDSRGVEGLFLPGPAYRRLILHSMIYRFREYVDHDLRPSSLKRKSQPDKQLCMLYGTSSVHLVD